MLPYVHNKRRVLDGIGYPHNQFVNWWLFLGNFSFPVTSTPDAIDTFYLEI